MRFAVNKDGFISNVIVAKEEQKEELEAALTEALEGHRGYVIDCVIDIDEKVRPMVGGGSHITQFMLD